MITSHSPKKTEPNKKNIASWTDQAPLTFFSLHTTLTVTKSKPLFLQTVTVLIVFLPMLEMSPENMIGGRLTAGMPFLNSYEGPHPVSFCPSELNPRIHQSYTLIIYLKNSLPSKCKHNFKNIIGTHSLSLEDRRRETFFMLSNLQ